MSTIHKFTGEWSNMPQWEGARSRVYPSQDSGSVTETWMIGKAEDAQNFAMRYYNVGPNCTSKKEQHPHDHGILILHGVGDVLLNGQLHPIEQGDIIYISPDIEHQLINRGSEPLGFICVIPAKRKKQGKIVWADENIKFD